MASCEEDFPEEKLGDAGGSGAQLAPKPIDEDKTKLQTPAGDVLMGTASSESASSAPKVDAGGTSEPATHSSAEAGSQIAGPFGASPVLPATSRSVLVKSTSPKEPVNLIIVPKRPSASLTVRHQRPEDLSVFGIDAAVCIDAAAQQLLACYVLKVNETEVARRLGQHDGGTAQRPSK